MIFKITDDKKHIEIEHKGEKGASFEDFTKLLPVEDCRYAVLDVEITTKSGATLRGKQGLHGRPARPKRLIGRGWPDLGAA